MPRRHRRQSLLMSAYWTVSLVGLTTLTAWQFGWPPFDAGGPDLANIDSGKHAGDDFSQTDLDDLEADDIYANSIVFTSQSEPDLDDWADELNARPASPRSTSSQLWDESMTPSMPAKFPNPAEARPISENKFSIGRRPSNRGESNIRSEVRFPRDRRVVSVSNQVEQSPVEPASTGSELQNIDRLMQSGEYLTAHLALSKLYWNNPEWHALLKKRIDTTAQSIYFSPQPHYMEPYVIQPGDQLRQIARKYWVPWQYLTKLNQIDERKIRPGQKLKVIKGPFKALVDLSDYELTIHARGYYVRSYPIGIGKDGSTPVGKFTVLNKVANPQYTDPDGKVIDADDPSNPLGERWIDLGDSYGIHGTINSNSVGRAESRGCIRLHNPGVEEIYDLLTIGSEVTIQR